MANTSNTQESWRPIWDAPNYMISDLGRVMRIRSIRSGGLGRMVKPWVSKDGYMMVSLTMDGQAQPKAFLLHRLICKAFVGHPPTIHHQAAHNNGVRTDNNPLNLRWATAKENTADRVIHGTDAIGRRNPRAKLTEEAVCEIRRHEKRWGVATKLGRQYGVTEQTISGILAGRLWRHIPWEDGVKPQPRCPR